MFVLTACYERPELNTNWLLFGSMLATKECKTSYFSTIYFIYAYINVKCLYDLYNPIVQLIFTEHNSSILTMFRILRDFVFNEFGPLCSLITVTSFIGIWTSLVFLLLTVHIDAIQGYCLMVHPTR